MLNWERAGQPRHPATSWGCGTLQRVSPREDTVLLPPNVDRCPVQHLSSAASPELACIITIHYPNDCIYEVLCQDITEWSVTEIKSRIKHQSDLFSSKQNYKQPQHWLPEAHKLWEGHRIHHCHNTNILAPAKACSGRWGAAPHGCFCVSSCSPR